MPVNIHFSVNATEPFKEIASRSRADLVANTPCISRFSRETFLAFSSAKSVQFPSWGRETFNAARSLSLITLCAISDTWRNDRSSIDAAEEDERRRSRRRRNSFVPLLCRNFYADPSMDGARRPLCMLRGISSRHLSPSIRLSPPGVSQLRGALDYDEAGFMLQLWHKGICEAWLASTISSTTRLYLLARDELGDLNFRGCAVARYIVTRRIIVDAVDS